MTPDGYVLNNAMASFYNDPSLPNNLGDIAGQRPFQGLLLVIATETNGRCGSLYPFRHKLGGCHVTLPSHHDL